MFRKGFEKTSKISDRALKAQYEYAKILNKEMEKHPVKKHMAIGAGTGAAAGLLAKHLAKGRVRAGHLGTAAAGAVLGSIGGSIASALKLHHQNPKVRAAAEKYRREWEKRNK